MGRAGDSDLLNERLDSVVSSRNKNEPNDLTVFYVDEILLELWEELDYCPSNRKVGWYWCLMPKDLLSEKFKPHGPFKSRKKGVEDFLKTNGKDDRT